MTAIVLHVELTFAPGKRDEYLARARRHRATVLEKEDGCRTFDISVPEDDENVVRLYEVYEDEAAVEHHMNTPYMQEYREDTGPITVGRRLTRATMIED